MYKWSRSQDQVGHHALYGKNLQKSFYTELIVTMIMKRSMDHYEIRLYIVYKNDDSELTLTYFTTMSNLAKLVFVLILGTDIR